MAPMNDAELAKFLEIENEPQRDKIIAGLTPDKRALYDKMAALCAGEAVDTVHVDSAEQHPDVPEVSAHCGRSDCPWPNFCTSYGMAGGGMGVYEFCDACERVVSKTQTD